MRSYFTFTLFFFTHSVLALSILSFNIENLFDTQDNPLTNDEQFLPKNHASKKKCHSIKSGYRKNQCLRFNWDQKQLESKLKRLAKTIESAGNADILGLVEVENKFVLKELNKKLNDQYEKILVSTKFDGRGIRNAVMLKKSSDIKYISSRDWPVDIGTKKTRSVFEVIFEKKGHRYCLFVNHWPSQGSPTAKRVVAAKTLGKAIDGARKKKCTIVALGDFNTLDHEYPDPFAGLLKAGLMDLTMKLRKKGKILGTYFFGPKMAWNFLDRVFLLKKQTRAFKDIRASVIVNSLNSGVWEQTRADSPYYGSRVVGVPKRFKAGGVSDHFPLLIEFQR